MPPALVNSATPEFRFQKPFREQSGFFNAQHALGTCASDRSQVNVGKAPSSGRLYDTASKFEDIGAILDGQRAVPRTLGVSLLGACSSKGCPTKSVENEDRYVHVSFFFQFICARYFAHYWRSRM